MPIILWFVSWKPLYLLIIYFCSMNYNIAKRAHTHMHTCTCTSKCAAMCIFHETQWATPNRMWDRVCKMSRNTTKISFIFIRYMHTDKWIISISQFHIQETTQIPLRQGHKSFPFPLFAGDPKCHRARGGNWRAAGLSPWWRLSRSTPPSGLGHLMGSFPLMPADTMTATEAARLGKPN